MISWEADALLWIQNTLRGPILDPVMITYTKLGDLGLLWIALSFLLLISRKTRRAGLLSLSALVVGLLLCNGCLKPLVSRPRPWLTVEGLVPLIEEADPKSFPSGHACSGFAAAGVWMCTLPKKWQKALALFLAVWLAASRLYVGVHYPTDVLAGVAEGLFSAWLTLFSWKKAEPILQKRRAE